MTSGIRIALTALCVCALGGPAGSEVRQWSVPADDSWTDLVRGSAAIDFNTAGEIRLLGFRSDDNIAEQLIPWTHFTTPGYIDERAEAYIWDNIAVSRDLLAMVDGDETTSTGDGFKGGIQTDIKLFFDLGARFPVSRIRFFPRLSGTDEEGRPFEEDFIRGFSIESSDGLSFNDLDQPIFLDLSEEDFTTENLTDIEFSPQFIRHLRLTVQSPNPFEIAEFQIFGKGFAAAGTYLSEIIDPAGQPVNFTRLFWAQEGLRQEGDEVFSEAEADVAALVRMRTGSDDTPQIYYRITDPVSGEREEVTEDEYDGLDLLFQAPIQDDVVNWSPWSTPFAFSGSKVELPSARRYFQIEVVMQSGAILDGVAVSSLSVEYAVPPRARQVVAEVSRLDEPQPPGDVTVVPGGVFASFALDVKTEFSEGLDTGFDAIRIFTPSTTAQLSDFLLGSPPVSVLSDIEWTAVEDTLTVRFPAHAVTEAADSLLRVVFDAQIFVQGTQMNAEVFATAGDDGSAEPPQIVLAGDANPAVSTDGLTVLTSAESSRSLLASLEITPPVLTPNGDDVNDETKISYSIVQLVSPVEVDVEIFDLSGRRVRHLFGGQESSGAFTWEWDGADDGRNLLPVGIYLAKVSVHTDEKTFERMGTVALVY